MSQVCCKTFSLFLTSVRDLHNLKCKMKFHDTVEFCSHMKYIIHVCHYMDLCSELSFLKHCIKICGFSRFIIFSYLKFQLCWNNEMACFLFQYPKVWRNNKKVYYIRQWSALLNVCILQCRSLPVPLGIFTEIFFPHFAFNTEADEVCWLAFECLFFS